ncbi:MAG: PKD domain-containing protein [Limisphaerales bacterium]
MGQVRSLPIQDNAHYSNSGTASLVVNNFGPDDAGFYQVMATNAFGSLTSQMAQVVIHAVDIAGINPVTPYSTWATAATNIQDAINIASIGDIVLVTNGIYAVGGKVMAGNLTNRVALDKAVTVMSVNGFATTVIQGAWDAISTNGLGAVRCAYLTDGAILNGFTLQNGATRSSTGFPTAPAESGGGVWCVSTNGIVSNCVLSNNSAIYGGGTYRGTLNNSLVVGNWATYGGGAHSATLNNCTVTGNITPYSTFNNTAGGTHSCSVRNSIVLYNLVTAIGGSGVLFAGKNYYSDSYSYSCTYPLIAGAGNIDATSNDPQFLDLFHVSATSPCVGTGNILYASGTDLDGEAWTNPPSMGCDEIIVSNLTGPLSVNLLAYQTNLLVNRLGSFLGVISGRVSRVEWSFGDGPTITNLGTTASHTWTNLGDYTVTFTAYNNDNFAGVSTNTVVHVLLPNVPQLQSPVLLTNGFQFQFAGQLSANYTIQYTTNLTAPATWQTLQTINFSSGGVIQINDSAWTNAARFYRVLAQ